MTGRRKDAAQVAAIWCGEAGHRFNPRGPRLLDVPFLTCFCAQATARLVDGRIVTTITEDTHA